jgi:hypothetical protein
MQHSFSPLLLSALSSRREATLHAVLNHLQFWGDVNTDVKEWIHSTLARTQQKIASATGSNY